MPLSSWIMWRRFFTNNQRQTYEHGRYLHDGAYSSQSLSNNTWKSNHFASVVLRLWVLVQSQSNSQSPIWQPRAHPTEPPVCCVEWNLKKRFHQRLCLDAWHIKSTHAPSSCGDGRLLAIYTSLTRIKADQWEYNRRQVTTLGHLWWRHHNRGVKNVESWIVIFYVAFILNQSSIKLLQPY